MAIDWDSLKSTEDEGEQVSAPGSDDQWSRLEFSTPEDAPGGAFVDPGLGEPAEVGPSFLGKRWREITDVEEKRQAWEWLREWVDWFVLEYKISVNLIPWCWFMHREIVAELWAAANAEYKVWEEGAPSTLPLTGWQNMLPGIKARLEDYSPGWCVNQKQHVVDPGSEDHRVNRLRGVDEDLWAKHLGEVVDEQQDLRPGRWRAGVTDEQGELVFSEPVQVGEQAQPGSVEVTAPVLSVDGAGRFTASVRARGRGLHRVWWEHEQAGEWVVVQTSMRDVSAQDPEDETGKDGDW